MSFWKWPVIRNISQLIWGPAHPRIAEGIEDCTVVETITARQLGKKIVEKCGNEGQWWPRNTAEQTRTRELLQAAISYIPEANDNGIDLSNATFYFAMPGCEFAIIAGEGIWEIQFSFNLNERIQGQCVNMPKYKWLWNKTDKHWERIVNVLGIAANVAPKAIKYWK